VSGQTDILITILCSPSMEWVQSNQCECVCVQLSEIGVELGFILDDLLSSDLNKLIQQAGDNQMDAVRHRATVSTC